VVKNKDFYLILRFTQLKKEIVFQMGTYYFGVKIFNKLPSNIKDQAYDLLLEEIPTFKLVLFIG
jgi:hypothetical protein